MSVNPAALPCCPEALLAQVSLSGLIGAVREFPMIGSSSDPIEKIIGDVG